MRAADAVIISLFLSSPSYFSLLHRSVWLGGGARRGGNSLADSI
jgi:hypothetical protein